MCMCMCVCVCVCVFSPTFINALKHAENPQAVEHISVPWKNPVQIKTMFFVFFYLDMRMENLIQTLLSSEDTWHFSWDKTDVYHRGAFQSTSLLAVRVWPDSLWYLWARAKDQADDLKHHLYDEDNTLSLLPLCVFLLICVCVAEGSMCDWAWLHTVLWSTDHLVVFTQM